MPYRAKAHHVGCDERRGAEQAVGRSNDYVRWCFAEHPYSSPSEEELDEVNIHVHVGMRMREVSESMGEGLCVFCAFTRGYRQKMEEPLVRQKQDFLKSTLKTESIHELYS